MLRSFLRLPRPAYLRELRCKATSVELLNGSEDRFGGVTVNVGVNDSVNPDAFHLRLRASVEAWRSEGRRAIWAHVPNDAGSVVPALLSEGFDWHHAKPSRAGGGYALLTRWLADEPDNLPLYPSTQVGVGGLVLNKRGEVLLMQERISVSDKVHGLWKIPGGLADPGEDIVDAAAREVYEETGVKAKGEGVLCIHHRHGYRHGVSDLYFTVRMKAETEETAVTPEARAVTWMPAPEALDSPEVLGFNKRIIAVAEKGLLFPHLGRHGSGIAKKDFFFYASTSELDPL